MPIAIFDMDGVLYRGAQVLPYAQETLDRLRRARWDVFFATNNSTATRRDYLRRLEQLQLGGDLDHIVTSGFATAHYLERRRPLPQDVLVIGADGLREEIRAVGIDHYSIAGARDPMNSLSHSILLAANLWIVEELSFPDEVFALPQPFEFMSLPINLKGHTGAYCRPVAILR